MKPFLLLVAEDIIEKYGKNYAPLCFVFQNKRAGMFFRHYFAKAVGSTVWSPEVYPIEKFVSQLTGLTLADDLSLIFDLYEIYRTLYQDINHETISFDHFYSLGELILSDLNDIDANLVDTNALFANLSNLQTQTTATELLTDEQKTVLGNFWSHFEESNSSTEKKKFITLWNILPKLYNEFRNKLLTQKIAYSGLKYRHLADMLDRKEVRFPHYERFIFVGFNALNRAEEKLFSYLNYSEKASFYWDNDEYYLNNMEQEAGMFQRSNIQRIAHGVFPPLQSLNDSSKSVEVIGVPLNVGQSQLIPNLISEMCGSFDNCNESTAIVLPDENMLLPVLQAIPPEINKINISMGYPFAATNLYSLIEKFLQLQTQFSQNSKGENEYYIKDVVPLLSHPEILFKIRETASALLEKYKKENSVYIRETSITANDNRIIKLIFRRYEKSTHLLEALLNLLYELFMSGKDINQNTENSFEDEFVYQAYLSVKRLKEVFDSKQFAPELITTVRILKQTLGKLRIPFSGEPLEGIQLLGLLETRNLDFDNVIILNVNEGILPKPYSGTSVISQFLRHSFGLQTVEKADAISAYLFYRLLQRAKNIRIVYNNIVGYNSSKELSRFVLQLQYESKLNIVFKQLKQNIIPAHSHPIAVQKTEEILRTLRKYLIPDSILEKDKTTASFTGRRFSASAINMYLDCRLKFYYRYIAGIKEKNEYSDEINQLEFGNLLHKAIELIYNDFLSTRSTKQIEISDFETLLESVDSKVDKAFVEVLNQTGNENFELKGNQLIIREVIKRYAISILRTDKKHAPFSIVSLEAQKAYTGFVDFFSNDELKRAAFSATIDRIDLKNNEIRIVDYKTGNTEHHFSSVEDFFDPNRMNRKKAIFQLFLYSKLYADNDVQALPVYPVIYSVRNLHQADFDPRIFFKIKNIEIAIDGSNIQTYTTEMLKGLALVLSEIFDASVPFEQTNNQNTCEYCPYRKICNK